MQIPRSFLRMGSQRRSVRSLPGLQFAKLMGTGSGETFTLIGTDKNGTLGTEITLFVDGNENTKIHTSCSNPIGPGLVSGDFTVIDGYSRNGGQLPPL